MDILGYKLVVFIPETHVEAVKTALFQAGAGRLGNYDACSWQCLGQGQFRALDEANPFIGEIGQVEQVSEYRVETLCKPEVMGQVLSALKQSHPYETPAFDIFPVLNPDSFIQ